MERVLESGGEWAEAVEGDGLQAAMDSLGMEGELRFGAEWAESLTDVSGLVVVGCVERRGEIEDAGGDPALVDGADDGELGLFGGELAGAGGVVNFVFEHAAESEAVAGRETGEGEVPVGIGEERFATFDAGMKACGGVEEGTAHALGLGVKRGGAGDECAKEEATEAGGHWLAPAATFF
jgi:hypothetical protein